MRIVPDLRELTRGRPTVLTIGTFDGVHRGHQWLVRQIVQRARALDFDALVVTFDPAPAVVLRPGSEQLTSGPEKSRIMGSLGVTTLALLPFSREMAQVPAGQFLETLLEHVNIAEVWIGGDFAFGHNREGNVEYLVSAGQRNLFSVMVVPRRPLNGVPISSTRVRELVRAGDMVGAAELLGHYVALRGRVVTGAGRGRTLGFPTANIEYAPTQVLPGTGIYAGYLRLQDRRLPAAISLGYNVVFGDATEIKAEAYVLDFDADLVGQDAAIELVARIRDEQNFSSVDALVMQMHRDVETVRGVLREAREPGEWML